MNLSLSFYYVVIRCEAMRPDTNETRIHKEKSELKYFLSYFGFLLLFIVWASARTRKHA